jgi:hypothetical protein
MRVLLLHPDDAFHGSWTRQHWDSVIDLGRAPKSFYDERSAALGCPVFSVFDLAVEVADLQIWRQLLELGMGQVVDRFGIDWWDVISHMLQPELQDVRLALRLAEKLSGCRTLAVSRPSATAEALRLQLGIPLQVLHGGLRKRLVRSVLRRGRALANLSFEQLRQVVYDKYDPHYRWRKTSAGSPAQSSKWKSESVVLLPSAYSNVTKTALSYAKILPEQKFLLVLARESGAVSPVPANVETTRLAAFATNECDRNELQKLENCWRKMEQSLQEHPAFRLPVQIGILKKGPRWLRWGLAVRDAWVQVFETRSVAGCLSADDSNPYTRIPLLLAEQRGIPAVACHHGALDCRMAFKNLRFSTYLAKGEMERDYLERGCGVGGGRIRIGAAAAEAPGQENASLWREDAPWIVFFTEPYETDFWRVEAIYREVLPRLCAAARGSGKTVILKLHPFESARQRRRLVKRTLNEHDRKLVSVTDAPLSGAILRNTWCAVTVESTVAFECASRGIPAFLCGWLRHAYAGYAPQYVRFAAGRMLESPDDLLRISDMLGAAMPGPNSARRLVQAISAEALSEVLCPPARSGLRSMRDGGETGA